MQPNVELEVKVIERFVIKAKQERYIQFVSSAKNRHKFINDLSHFNFLREDLLELVEGDEKQVILHALQNRGISEATCYVISENEKIDTMTLRINEAIDETVGWSMGTILVFGAADMIFYESETMNTRFVSKKVY